MEHNYYVPTHFRTLTEDQIGVIQVRLHDLKERAADVAAEFRISSSTVYRVKNAVPKELLTINEIGVRQFRKGRRRKRKTA